MGIKENRNARLEHLYNQFVSLKGLINHIASEEQLDISEVAAELERAIKNPHDSELPVFGSVDVDAVEFVPWADGESMHELLDWLSDTVMGCGHGENTEFFGWMRDDLFPFLASSGFDVKPNFPLWAPSSEVTNNTDVVSSGISEENTEIRPIEYPTPDDVDHENWPERLGIAITAWRAACNADLSETTPREFMKAWLSENYPSIPALEVTRLATVANWDTSRGRPPKKEKK